MARSTASVAMVDLPDTWPYAVAQAGVLEATLKADAAAIDAPALAQDSQKLAVAAADV